jgi:hypothetical protein
MSFGFGISDFEYVFNVIFRVRNFLKGIKDAPKDFDALRAEAECLEVCLNTISYEDCSRILLKVTPEQAKDLKTIIHGCRMNMEELVGFVAKCQWIAADIDGRKPEDTSVSEWFRIAKRMEQNLWTKLVFVWKEKQPMREKLAIPIQSLNIYLVSLTYVSLSYNIRLSGGPGSDPVGFDSNHLSPHKPRSPPRHSARDAPYAYEERSPHQESSARYKEQRESRVFELYDEKDEIDEAAMRRARRKGYDDAREQIKEERKKAITEMTAGVAEIRASQVPSHPRSSSIASEPDVRTYIEVIYGVIIDRAPPEVERINAEEFKARSRIHEPVVDSDESFDADSEPEGQTRTNSFAIPEEEYTPCTKGFGGLQTFMADRDSLREREMSIREREVSLRERETALRERERTFRER